MAGRLAQFSPDIESGPYDYASEAFGDPMFQQVQEGGERAPGPVRQPAPVDQDALRGYGTVRPRPAPKPSAPAPEQHNYADEAFGGPTSPPASTSITPRLSRQKRDGDMRGAVQRYVEGYQDPAYANVPGFDWENTNAGVIPSFVAKMTAPNDTAYAEIIKSQLGPNFIGMKQDKHGQPVVIYRDADGKEQTRYVNRPGLDWQDLERGVFGAVPYLATGGIVGGLQKGAGLISNVLGQGLTAGATRVGADLTAMTQGSKQTPNLVDTGLTAAMGGAGAAIARPVGMVDRRLRQVPALVDDAGQLTAKGAEVAKQSGIDPAILQGKVAQDFAKIYAQSGDAAEAAIKGAGNEWGMEFSRGQITKDPKQLLLEKNYRAGLYGDASEGVMRRFFAKQDQDITRAALGNGEGPSVAGMINPSRTVVDQTPEVLGASIQSGIREAERKGGAEASRLFIEAGDAAASPEALAQLPGFIQNRVSSFRISEKLHPNAFEMGTQIEAFMGGKAPGNSLPGVFGQGRVPNVDEFRKELFTTYKGAQGADREAAKRIYEGYDDWMKSAADKALLTGDPGIAVKLRTARDAYRELKDKFEPTADGKKLPAARVIEKVMQDGTSAAEVIQNIFGGQGLKSAPKAGSVQALQNIKQALHKWGDGANGARSQSWDDIRLAYWTKLVHDRQGEVLKPQTMLTNIQSALRSQREVMSTLYTNDEMRAILSYAAALRTAATRDPNGSGTATALGLMTRDLATNMIRIIGWQGGGLMGMIGAGAMTLPRNAAGAWGAKNAIRQGGARTVDPPIGPYSSAGTQAILRTDLGGSD